MKAKFDKIGQQLGCKELEEWYNITSDAFRQCGDGGLLDKIFHGSLRKALQSVYPHHDWLTWKFVEAVPSGYWDNMENQRKFMDYLGKQLGFNKMDEWYQVTPDIIRLYG